MLQSRTLFIVGAGASREFGLPTGVELMPKISQALSFSVTSFGRLDGDKVTLQAIDGYLRKNELNSSDIVSEIERLSSVLRSGLIQAISIDNYLDAHQSNQLINIIGKIGITRCILDAEQRSSIYVPISDRGATINFKKNSDKWLFELFKILNEGVSREDCEHIFENVEFISFNYDRCVEHYFLHALMVYYNIDRDRATKIVRDSLKVHHPYGKIGALDWQGPRQSTHFGGGERMSGPDLLSVAEQIRTFTEQIEEGDDLMAMRSAVADAETIVALGFAFHPQNLALIQTPRPSKARRVFATAYKVSRSDRNVLTNDILGWLNAGAMPAVDLVDMTCGELFNEFRRSIPRG